MRKLLVFLLAGAFFLLLAAPKPASSAPIFPPLVQGLYCFKIRAASVDLDANGVPTTTPTASVGVRRADAASPANLPIGPAGEPCVLCGPGETVSVCALVQASGDRGELRGYAFAGADCTGDSAESDNAAWIFFVPPGEPTLELEP